FLPLVRKVRSQRRPLRRAARVWAASWLPSVCPTLGGAQATRAGSAAPGRVCEGGAMAWIELEGAVNVRDLGDLPTEDGQKTVRARLLRADNLQDLSAADVRKLVHDIGVTTVVDLRSSHDLAAEGAAPLDAMAGGGHAPPPVLPEVGSATEVIADALLTRDRMDKFRY